MVLANNDAPTLWLQGKHVVQVWPITVPHSLGQINLSTDESIRIPFYIQVKLGRGPLGPVVAKLECYPLGVAVVTFPDL